MTGPAVVRGLIIYTRFPEPGSTKTRLIPVLGAEGACRLHRQLTENIIAEIRKLRTNLPMKVEVHFSGGSSEQMAAWLGRDWDYEVQVGGDIGARMERSFEQAFRRGWNQAILIGSDLPEMTGRILREAFRRLDEHELVLGPAQDGGYYLIGLKAPRPELFGGHILWGTPEVLEKTLLTAEQLGLKTALLSKLRDIDRPEDLTEKSIFRDSKKVVTPVKTGVQ